MCVLYYLLVCLIQITNCQIPKHVDLQKVGEITYNNEIYNILRPTVHKITDHFRDFMLRQGIKDKNEKIFLDDEGFRHYWSGVGKISKNLRKTEVSMYGINKNTFDEPEIANADSENINLPDSGEGKADKPILRAVTTKKPAATTKKPAATTKKPAATTKKPVATTKNQAVTTKKPAATTNKPAPAGKPAGNAASGVGAAKPKGGRKVARTSFFCPFYGVISMVTYI